MYPILTYWCWAWINRSTSNLDFDEHCGWTLPYCRSLALINVPSALNLIPCLIFCFSFHCLCSTPQKLEHSNWCYCETNRRNEQIRSITTELLKQTNCGCRDCFWLSTEENNHKKQWGKKNIPVECGCSVLSQRVEIVFCVSVLVSSPSQQAATTSYPALADFRAVHRNGTNQQVKPINQRQQQWKKSKNYKLWIRCPSSFQQ